MTRVLVVVLWISLTVLLIVMASGVSAHPPIFYKLGEFPKGHLYTESDLESIVDKDLDQPAYLIGSFVFLGKRDDWYVFSNYAQGYLEQDKQLAFGNILVVVKFYNNVPGALEDEKQKEKVKLLVPDSYNPLTILDVKRATDGIKIIVVAESLSAN